MADWISCPGCQLRHSRRPDGLCPRCKQSVDGGGIAEVPPVPESAPSALTAGTAGLGNLAQSARDKQLRGARGIMLFVGILTVLVNGYFFLNAESAVQKELDKEILKIQRTPGMVVDYDKVKEVKEQAVGATRLLNGGGMLLGMVFLGCAAMVKQYAVPATATALAVYLAGNAIFGFLEPSSLARGLIIKVFIVIALFKAVQAAIAYQKEEASSPAVAA